MKSCTNPSQLGHSAYLFKLPASLPSGLSAARGEQAAWSLTHCTEVLFFFSVKIALHLSWKSFPDSSNHSIHPLCSSEVTVLHFTGLSDSCLCFTVTPEIKEGVLSVPFSPMAFRTDLLMEQIMSFHQCLEVLESSHLWHICVTLFSNAVSKFGKVDNQTRMCSRRAVSSGLKRVCHAVQQSQRSAER